ncbi:Ig-like domain-containing protein [Flavobacterium sp. PLA-1-15]|uniref:Ig-like domain-containing protein n=1 Tax=Flavobacterium sp. PLA-1-15 TaxID=3380533 RepID=UPI003B7C67C1
MKKNLLLLVVAFLPIFGFAQELVRWNGGLDGFSATTVANVVSANINKPNSISMSNNGQWNQFFETGGWPNPQWPTQASNGLIDTARYIEFIVKPSTGHQINLSAFNFEHKGNGVFQIRYSKDPSFSTNVYTLLGETSTNGNWTSTNIPANSFSSVNPVLANETVYIRVYAYRTWNTFQIRHSWGGATGPMITGTVTSATPPVPTAVNDNATTLQNQAVTINVLSNDTNNNLATGVEIVTGQGPANGNVAVNNTTNQITYTPASAFTGTNTFKYRIKYGTNSVSNEATVTVNVTAPILPTAVADNLTAPMNGLADLNVLSNDNLGSATSVTAINTTNPTHGTVTVNANNTIRYTPTAGYVGTDSFTYRIQTVYGASSYVQVSLTVQPQTPTSGPLCGDYYVGTGGHFTTLTQAVNYLNANGVNCAVTFLLTNTLYQNVDGNANGEVFPLEINGATINTTTTNTVTFKPAANLDVTVRVNNVTVSYNLIHPKALFKLNGADNIIFEGQNGSSNLTLVNNDPNNSGGNHRTVIWLANNTDNIVIRNLDIAQGNDNANSTFSAGIYSGSDSIIGGAANNTNTNLIIEGNNFSSRVIQGIYLNNSSISSTGVMIHDNTFGKVFNPGIDSKTHNPIYLNGVTNFQVYKNEIKSVNSTFTADHYRAIYVYGSNGRVYNNTIYDIKRASSEQTISGIWLKSNVGTNPVNITVSNNFITDVQAPGSSSWTQGAYGIVTESGSGFKIYHNTVNLKQQTQTTGISAAFLTDSAVDLDVRNNIFNNNLTYSGPGKAAIAIVNYAASTFAYLDYNNYYSQGIIGIRGSISNVSAQNPTYIATMAEWKSNTTGVGKDVHSTTVQPVFVNENSDLHLVPTSTVNVQYLTGVTVSQTGITHDIDGHQRYIPAPTMGADEIAETCAPTGDQAAFGIDSWIGYVYDNSVGFDINNQFQSSKYKGYILESNPTFTHNYGGGAISGPYMCGTYYDTFAIRHKMRKNFPAGYYTFTVSGDDGYRLSVNGTEVLADWNDHGPTTASASIYLNGSTDLILEFYENAGGATISFNYTMCTPTATAPTSISGNLTVCAGSPTTLTAVGATGTGVTYQWGTGSVVGTNPIANQNGASITVSPTQQTTYWVRAIDGTCQSPTSGVTAVVAMGSVAGNPTVFGSNAWNVYAFNETSMTPSLSNYKGFYTQNTVSVNTTTAWGINASPSTATTTPTNTAYQGCPVGNDNFTFIQKRRGFPAGSYELRMVAWDDATMVFVNGVEVVNYGGWYNGTDMNNLVGVYCLGPNSTIEIRTIENGGEAQVRMNLVPINVIYNSTGWTTGPNERAVEIQSNINIETSLEVCTCTVKAGTTLTVKSNQTLTVVENIVVEDGGKIIVENNGALVQVDDDATYTGLPASFTAMRNAQPMYRYDFTYWSSPVESFRLKDVSPFTLFDKFYSWNSTTQAWTTLPQPASSTTLMEPGIGYIVRAPQSYSTNPTIRDTWESIFIGRPNNGVKEVTVANGADNKWNLIGNPYASAIEVSTFMATNADVIEGAIYLWSHNSAIVPVSNGSQVYTYSASDYVTVNAAGLVAAGPQTNSLGVNNGDDFKIASGQSFFVKGKVSNPTGTQVRFNNAMRVRQGGENNQFFRPNPSDPNQNWETTGKHRVWLNMTGANNAFNQLMVGYIENATNGLDSRFDADVFSGGTVSMYSLLEEKKLTIQGRALPFNNQDQVPLGYKTTLTGTLKIGIDHFDGLFEGQNVYLEDKAFNIVHNLKESDYTFTTIPGTFNDRFVLRYVPAAELGIDNPAVDENSIIVFGNGNQIDIKSKDQSIEQVTVYDLLGKIIFDKSKINATSFSTTQLNASNQVVIVKVITDTKAEVVKKVIMN